VYGVHCKVISLPLQTRRNVFPNWCSSLNIVRTLSFDASASYDDVVRFILKSDTSGWFFLRPSPLAKSGSLKPLRVYHASFEVMSSSTSRISKNRAGSHRPPNPTSRTIRRGRRTGWQHRSRLAELTQALTNRSDTLPVSSEWHDADIGSHESRSTSNPLGPSDTGSAALSPSTSFTPPSEYLSTSPFSPPPDDDRETILPLPPFDNLNSTSAAQQWKKSLSAGRPRPVECSGVMCLRADPLLQRSHVPQSQSEGLIAKAWIILDQINAALTAGEDEPFRLSSASPTDRATIRLIKSILDAPAINSDYNIMILGKYGSMLSRSARTAWSHIFTEYTDERGYLQTLKSRGFCVDGQQSVALDDLLSGSAHASLTEVNLSRHRDGLYR